MNSSSPSNAETEKPGLLSETKTIRLYSFHVMQTQLFLSLIGSASHSFAVISLLSWLTTTLSTDKADLLAVLKRLVTRSFWFTVSNQAKGLSFLYFQITCILTEWMRFRILLFCFVSGQRSWTYQSQKSIWLYFSTSNSPLLWKALCGGKEQK